MAAEIDFDLSVTGFSIAEVDQLVEGLAPSEAGDRPMIGFLSRRRSRALPPRRYLAARTAPARLRRLA